MIKPRKKMKKKKAYLVIMLKEEKLQKMSKI